MKQMKPSKAILITLALYTATTALSQITIGPDSSSTDPSAILEIRSFTKGFLPPRMTTLQREAISNPAEGLVIYNTDSRTIQVFNGSVWTLDNGKFTCGVSQVIDTAGIRYPTVNIGHQCWMGRNLRAGTMIDSAHNQTIGWVEKYCFRNSPDSCEVYGGLYQWNELMAFGYEGTQGICPNGWHVPSPDEWTALAGFLGGTGAAGGKLKEVGSRYWMEPNTGSNSSGFAARGAGYRSTTATFENFLMAGMYWTSLEEDETYANAVYVTYNSDSIAISVDFNKNLGLSVRCIKDPDDFHF